MEISLFNNSLNSSNRSAFAAEIRQFLVNVRFVLLFVETVLITFGLIGNLIAIIVINKKCLRNTSSSVFITALAIFDSFVLISHGLNLIKISGYALAQCVLYGFTDLATFCASWFLVIITIERCIAVYSPLFAKRLSTVQSARNVVCIFVAFSIICFTITFPLIYDLPGALAYNRCRIYQKFSLLIRIYELTLCYGMPGLFLLTNIFTVYSLCRRTRSFSKNVSNNENNSEMRINDTNSNRKQGQLTIMLLTIMLSFYVFTTPAMIFYIMESRITSRLDAATIKRKHIYSQMSVVLLQLNNATNFIFYCFAGQRFRRATLEIFHKYSSRLKIFYHRYIICDKEYALAPTHDDRSIQFRQRLFSTTTRTTRQVICDSKTERDEKILNQSEMT